MKNKNLISILAILILLVTGNAVAAPPIITSFIAKPDTGINDTNPTTLSADVQDVARVNLAIADSDNNVVVGDVVMLIQYVNDSVDGSNIDAAYSYTVWNAKSYSMVQGDITGVITPTYYMPENDVFRQDKLRVKGIFQKNSTEDAINPAYLWFNKYTGIIADLKGSGIPNDENLIIEPGVSTFKPYRYIYSNGLDGAPMNSLSDKTYLLYYTGDDQNPNLIWNNVSEGNYSATIRAENDQDSIHAYIPISVSYGGEDNIPPGDVTSLTASSITESSITWTWTNPGDNDLANIIVKIVKTIDNTVIVPETRIGIATSYEVTGLDAGTEYRIIVKTEDDAY